MTWGRWELRVEGRMVPSALLGGGRLESVLHGNIHYPSWKKSDSELINHRSPSRLSSRLFPWGVRRRTKLSDGLKIST